MFMSRDLSSKQKTLREPQHRPPAPVQALSEGRAAVRHQAGVAAVAAPRKLLALDPPEVKRRRPEQLQGDREAEKQGGECHLAELAVRVAPDGGRFGGGRIFSALYQRNIQIWDRNTMERYHYYVVESLRYVTRSRKA